MFDFIFQADEHLLRLVSGFAGQVGWFDVLVDRIQENELAKGVVTVMLVWALWFGKGEHLVATRLRLMATALIGVTAVAVGQGLALLLPFRDRPIHDPDLKFNRVLNDDVLQGWSSFPSDHAVLFFALATSLFMINRTVGLVALLHAAVIVSLPRIYLGLHFPSDIIGGAMLGVAIALILMRPGIALVRQLRLLDWERASPSTFYPAMFFISFQIASMFYSVREAVNLA